MGGTGVAHVVCLLLLSGLAGCGGSTPSPPASAQQAPQGPIAAPMPDASVPAVTAPQPLAPAAVEAPGRPATAQDVMVTLVPSSTGVAYDSAIPLDVRVTNTTAHPLLLRIAIPELIQSTDGRGAVSPTPLTGGWGPVDPMCTRVDCVAPAGALPREVTLGSGTTMHTNIRWKAERLAYGVMGCCPQPQRVGPLAPGRYTLTANVTIEGVGLVATSTEVIVRQ